MLNFEFKLGRRYFFEPREKIVLSLLFIKNTHRRSMLAHLYCINKIAIDIRKACVLMDPMNSAQ